MRIFVMGDIHGAYKALKQCLERVDFDYDQDPLIQLGDIVDRQEQVYECVEELLKIKHLIPVKGNHDEWFSRFLRTGTHPDLWMQGGDATALSYLSHAGGNRHPPVPEEAASALRPSGIPPAHRALFARQLLYYTDAQKNCFVHAGFDPDLPFGEQPEPNYYWDRALWASAVSFEQKKHATRGEPVFPATQMFRRVFVGHSPTLLWGKEEPMQAANMVNLDTGAGHTGKLTIMDLETEAYQQSDPVPELYGD